MNQSTGCAFGPPKPIPAAIFVPSSVPKRPSITKKLTLLLVDIYSHANPKFRLIDRLPQVL